MKRYIKSSLNYSQLEDLCTPIYQEIISNLRKIDLNHRWWHEYNRDNRDGTIRISFGTGVNNSDQEVTYSLKEARHTMLDAISLCSNSLQDSVIKVTQGTTGDRGMIWYVVGVYIRPSTNDYYNIH